MKTFINLTLAGLSLSCSLAAQSIFEGAEWIGTDEVVLNAPYLAEFSVSYDVAPKDGEQSVFYFGGNDERLMSRHFTLRPVADPTHQMTYAHGCYVTQYGTIRAGWETKDGKVIYKFTIPAGCSATLIVEGLEPEEYGEGTFEAEIQQ